MVENGIKPVYVFDGKPPEMKSGEVIFDFESCVIAPDKVLFFNHKSCDIFHISPQKHTLCVLI